MPRTGPRILFAESKDLEVIQKHYAEDHDFQKKIDNLGQSGSLLDQATAWAAGRKLEAGRMAVEALQNFELVAPRASGQYGSGLELALVYDLTRDHPAWNQDTRRQVNLLLRQNLLESLHVLDSSRGSLWHGRFQLAVTAWVAAVAMDHDLVHDHDQLAARTHVYFLEAVQALEYTQGWPEGYSYWINNRAFPFALSVLAHINSVEAPELNRRLVKVLETVGLWTIHGTEPRGRFVLFGDTGPRNDLKDMTQRVIDLIALATEDQVFRDYSRYLTGLWGRAACFSGHRWIIPLVRGHPDRDHGLEDGLDLSAFQDRLPTGKMFGANSLGHVFSRTHWGEDAMFVFYKAGHVFAHHGHYQAGHFSISRKHPLALMSGTYGDYTGEHRLNYYIRTVASNSLLIMRPGERVQPNRFFTQNVSDGGQRIVMPTGSAVQNLEHWKNNLEQGQHYQGGRIVAYDDSHSGIMYVSSDLTGAYNNTVYDETGGGGKVSEVTRQLVFLQDMDLVLVQDRVKSTSPDYTKKWLLHSWGRPETASEKVLKGTPDNGILESRDSRARIEYEGEVLEIARLLPRDGLMRKVGGPDYRYYVETDGDDSILSGKNMDQGASEQPWYDAGLWRLEIQPETENLFDNFLVLLQAGAEDGFESLSYELIKEDQVTGVSLPGRVVLFGRYGTLKGKEIRFALPQGEDSQVKVFLADLPPHGDVRIYAGESTILGRANSQGVAVFELEAGLSSVRVEVD